MYSFQVFIDEVVLNNDYLANGAQKLRQTIGADAETKRKLDDALGIFADMENKAKEHIKIAISELSSTN